MVTAVGGIERGFRSERERRQKSEHDGKGHTAKNGVSVGSEYRDDVLGSPC